MCICMYVHVYIHVYTHTHTHTHKHTHTHTYLVPLANLEHIISNQPFAQQRQVFLHRIRLCRLLFWYTPTKKKEKNERKYFYCWRQVFLSRIRLRRRQSRYTPTPKNHTQRQKFRENSFLSSRQVFLYRIPLCRLLFWHTFKKQIRDNSFFSFKTGMPFTACVSVACCVCTHAKKRIRRKQN